METVLHFIDSHPIVVWFVAVISTALIVLFIVGFDDVADKEDDGEY